jgi:hypothetical protein
VLIYIFHLLLFVVSVMFCYRNHSSQYKLFKHKNGSVIPCIATTQTIYDEHGDLTTSINTYVPLPHFKTLSRPKQK